MENELCSFSTLSVISPTSQFILQLFRQFTYITAHYTTLPSLHLRHSSFYNPSVVSPTSAEPHSPTLPSLHLRRSSFYNPSVASPTSQLILQPFRRFTYVQIIFKPFRRFTYVIGTSLTSPGKPPMLQEGQTWELQ